MRLPLLTAVGLCATTLMVACIPEEPDHMTEEELLGAPPPQLQGAQRPWTQRSATERNSQQPTPPNNEHSPALSVLVRIPQIKTSASSLRLGTASHLTTIL